MEKKEKLGFISLAKKTFAVITTSLSALLIDQSSALPAPATPEEIVKHITDEQFNSAIGKPQLILTLNQSNPNLAMNPSHGSHRSHSSHSSHSSHYSSSTSSSYTPEVTPAPTIAPKLTYHKLGSRTLQQGSEGTDVQQLQKNLIQLGYKPLSDGTFGASTKSAVMKFQTANSLSSTGIVDSLTLKKIQAQVK